MQNASNSRCSAIISHSRLWITKANRQLQFWLFRRMRSIADGHNPRTTAPLLSDEPECLTYPIASIKIQPPVGAKGFQIIRRWRSPRREQVTSRHKIHNEASTPKSYAQYTNPAIPSRDLDQIPIPSTNRKRGTGSHRQPPFELLATTVEKGERTRGGESTVIITTTQTLGINI